VEADPEPMEAVAGELASGGPPRKRRRKAKPWFDEVTVINRNAYRDPSAFTLDLSAGHTIHLPHRRTGLPFTTLSSDMCDILSEPFAWALEVGERRRRERIASAERVVPASPTEAAGPAASPATEPADSPIEPLEPLPLPDGTPNDALVPEGSPGAVPASPTLAGLLPLPLSWSAPSAVSPGLASPVLWPLTHTSPAAADSIAPASWTPLSGLGHTSPAAVDSIIPGFEEPLSPLVPLEGLPAEVAETDGLATPPAPSPLSLSRLAASVTPLAPRGSDETAEAYEVRLSLSVRTQVDEDMGIGIPELSPVPASPVASPLGAPSMAATPNTAGWPSVRGTVGEATPAPPTPEPWPATPDGQNEVCSFFELARAPPGDAASAATRFLNLLSMHMEGRVQLEQDEPYGDIKIHCGPQWPSGAAEHDHSPTGMSDA